MNIFQQEYEKIRSQNQNGKVGRIFAALKDTINGHPLVLYGAGRLADIFLSYCEEYGLSVSCICDAYKTGVYSKENPLRIIDMQTLLRDFYDATIIICSYRYNEEIFASLKKSGFTPEHIVQYPIDGPFLESSRTFERYVDGYSWAYHFFKDKRSQQTVLDRMRMYLQGHVMQPNTPCNVYYEDGFISFGENEIFVDGGACNGDSAEAFVKNIQKTGKAYARVYAFEPCAFSYDQAVCRLSAYENIEIVQKGLWSTETELSFFENSTNKAGSSFVAESGVGSRVPVTSLDVMFESKSNHELPTFIKMDIEGAEKEALLGAENVIRRTKPKLAICAYHKPEDIYELPQTILSIRDDYKLALRQHEPAGYYDTVLYAV